MNRLAGVWHSLAYNYRQGGLKQLSAKVAWRFNRWLRSETDWLVYRVEVADYHQQEQPPLERRELDFTELRELGYFKAISFPEMIRARLGSGAACHGFFLEGKLVNIAWTSAEYLEIERGTSISEPASFGIFDCYTLPEFRGRGFYPGSLINLIHTMRKENPTSVLIAVDPWNAPSIKGIERAGFKPMYRLIRSRRFGRDTFTREPFEFKFGPGQAQSVSTVSG